MREFTLDVIVFGDLPKSVDVTLAILVIHEVIYSRPGDTCIEQQVTL